MKWDIFNKKDIGPKWSAVLFASITQTSYLAFQKSTKVLEHLDDSIYGSFYLNNREHHFYKTPC